MRTLLFDSLYGQAILFGTAAVFLFATAGAPRPAGGRRTSPRDAFWLGAIAVCLVAARLALESLVWQPSDAFEEQGLGLYAFFAWRDGTLPVEFRYATLLAFSGLALGGFDYESLRAPFSMLGCASIVAMTLGLWRAGIDRLSILAACTVLATSPFFTICSSRADELCYGAAVSVLYLVLLANLDRARPSGPWTVGLLGLFSGMLLFEHTAYKLLALFGMSFVTIVVFRERRLGWPRKAALFIVPLLVVASPVANDMWNAGFGSSVFDGLYRHIYTRGTLFDSRAWEFLRKGAEVMAGRGPSDPRLTLPGEPIFPVWICVPWTLAWAAAVLGGGALERLLAVHVAVTLLCGTAMTRNFEPIRLAPAFVSLTVLLAFFSSRLSGRLPLRGLARAVFEWVVVGWSLFTISYSFIFHSRLGDSSSFEAVYSGMDAPHCIHIDTYSVGAERALVWSPKNTFSCYSLSHPRSLSYDSEGAWIYGNRLPVSRVDDLEFPDGVPPRTLVMVADKTGVEPAAEAAMTALARRFGADSIETTRDVDGRLAAMSFCHRCGPTGGRGS